MKPTAWGMAILRFLRIAGVYADVDALSPRWNARSTVAYIGLAVAFLITDVLHDRDRS